LPALGKSKARLLTAFYSIEQDYSIDNERRIWFYCFYW
jgi:hypothetical protein